MEIKQYEIGEQSVAKVTVAVDADKFDEAVNKSYMAQRSRIYLPGFRKGKAPRKVIEKTYGEGVFWEDAVIGIAQDVHDMLEEQKDLRQAVQGWIDSVEKDKDTGVATIQMSIPVYPTPDLPTYTGLTAPFKPAEVTDEEIEKQLEQVRKDHAVVTTVDRPSQMGDTVVIDFVGYLDNVPFPGGKSEDYYLELGSNSFIAGFEEQLVGAKVGGDVDVNVRFPVNYGAEHLRDKDALFKVHIKEVKEPGLPDLDDDFAQDVSEYDSLEEYRQGLRDELLKKRENESRDLFLNALVSQLAEQITFDFYPASVERQQELLIARQSASMGLPYESLRQMFGSADEKTRETMYERAANNLKAELILKEIAKRENIELTEEDKEREYAKLGESYGVDTESVKTFVSQPAFEDGVFMTKVADWLIEHSVKGEWTEEAAE